MNVLPKHFKITYLKNYRMNVLTFLWLSKKSKIFFQASFIQIQSRVKRHDFASLQRRYRVDTLKLKDFFQKQINFQFIDRCVFKKLAKNPCVLDFLKLKSDSSLKNDSKPDNL